MQRLTTWFLMLVLVGPACAGDTLSPAEALVKANELKKARPMLLSYLIKHPADPRAEALLGAVETRLGDNVGGAAAFRLAGTPPEYFRLVAVQAYTGVAVKALNEGDNPKAVDNAGRAIALQPEFYSYYLRGTAYTKLEKYPQAVADLEQAQELGSSGRAESSVRDASDGELVVAYMRNQQTDRGLLLAVELRQRSSDLGDRAVSDYYNQQAEKHSHEGRLDLTATDLETAARAVPSQAAALYVQAASALTGVPKSDWKHIKADADLALGLDRNNARATFIAGIATLRLGDKEAGITLLRQAKTLAAGDAALLKDIEKALLALGG